MLPALAVVFQGRGWGRKRNGKLLDEEDENNHD